MSWQIECEKIYEISELQFPIIGSVISGIGGGCVLSNSMETPSHIFVVHQFGFCQELYREYDADFVGKIRQFILDSDKKLRLYTPSYEMRTWLDGQERVACAKRIHYWGNVRELSSFESVFCSINEIKECDDRFDFGMDLPCRFYKDEKDYLKYGKPIGIASDDGKPAGVIYSAGFDGKRNEIDIFVDESFRNRGLAKILVANYTKMIKEKAEEVTWDCYVNNEASRKLAEFVGFEKSKEYEFCNIAPKSS